VRPIDRLLGRLSAQLPDALRVQLSRVTRAHRRFVSRPGSFDLAAASQFDLLTLLGLREHHLLLEIGCGSLRSGRLFLVYLEPGRYHAVEPERWLVEAAIENEIGRDLVRLKRPVFEHGRDFRLDVFGKRFDYIVAGSVFSHAAPAQIRACLGEAARVLAPDGLFLASWLEGPSDSTSDAWVYPERVAYTEETLRRVAAEAGLDCARLDWPYDFGAGDQRWLAFALPTPGAERSDEA
jgi:SAM-dependent methyltransferase